LSLGGVPGRYPRLASGAKAQFVGTFAQGLKPLPPKETAKVGPKGPTPDTSPATQGMEPRPPKETTRAGPKGPTSDTSPATQGMEPRRKLWRRIGL
jgi:hypothetical protein